MRIITERYFNFQCSYTHILREKKENKSTLHVFVVLKYLLNFSRAFLSSLQRYKQVVEFLILFI